MDLYKTGKLLARLRKENGLTQKQVAEKLGICPKTVSKWETGRGFPDVGMLEALSKLFCVDISKLLAGDIPESKSESCNMKKTKFYVCASCGNVITSVGDAKVVCCGRTLTPQNAKQVDDAHGLNIEKVEDEYYITFAHPMTKAHYISFVTYVRFDRVLTVKMYPEQEAALRFPQMRGGRMYFYCNTHGLFEVKL